MSENGGLEFFKLVELTSMPKLRVLNYRQLTNDEIKVTRQILTRNINLFLTIF